MQGYDSVHIKADVELGGTDQKFNLLVGRNLQRSFGQEAQIVMTLPLLIGLDGTQKMSKSLGNHVGVLDSPKDIFGKIMSIPDAQMENYYNLLTDTDGKKVVDDIVNNRLHPREAKKTLATEICAWLHDKEKAAHEAAEFDRIFRDKQAPQAPKEITVSEAQIWIVDLLKKADPALSSSEARRLVEQGGVTLDNEKITDPKLQLSAKTGMLLKVGKKTFVRLTKV
jgi:tyrosyl-tRNA synthetase